MQTYVGKGWESGGKNKRKKGKEQHPIRIKKPISIKQPSLFSQPVKFREEIRMLCPQKYTM